MPRRGLVLDDQFHPLAPFTVLAVMCHPHDRRAQDQIVAMVEAQTGVDPAKRPRLSEDAFWEQLDKAAYRGGVSAGGILLNIIQLAGNSVRPSFNNAYELLLAVLPKWEQPVSDQWRLNPPSTYIPRNRADVLDAFQRFLPVAHLWAALIHAEQHGRYPEIGPHSIETLPHFLAYAEGLLSQADRIRWQGRARRIVLPKNVSWRFKVPDGLQRKQKLSALPLEPEQWGVLKELRRR